MNRQSKKNFFFFCFLFFLFCNSTPIFAQVIISKVFANGSFELRNTSNGTIDISSYWICDYPDYRALNSLSIECGTMNLAAGATIVFSASGLHETDDSELGLYTTNSFGSAAALMSYVEWGPNTHQRSGLATGKGIWDGMKAPSFSSTQSIEVTGDGTKAADWQLNSTPQKCQTSTARYRVTFTAIWTSATHPTDYPSNAHWSGLIGMSHNADVALFELGKLASAGIVSMAETGFKFPLTSEIQNAVMAETGLTLISGGGISPGSGSVSVEFDMDYFYPLISITSMIAPSPDWFVGVNQLSLLENGDWVNQKTVQIGVYDAGSDSGSSFRSGNQPTNPRENITMITTPPLAVNGVVASMGTMTFQRIDGGNECITDRTVTDNPATGNYLASETIITSTNNPVEVTSTATFKAGMSITLQNGFHAASGSSFIASIENCAASLKASNISPNRVVMVEKNIERKVELEAEIALKIAPNPFVNTFNIDYSLPKAGQISIHLLDANGLLLEKIIAGENRTEGYHQININASHLPAGMYFVLLKTAQKMVVQKGILLK